MICAICGNANREVEADVFMFSLKAYMQVVSILQISKTMEKDISNEKFLPVSICVKCLQRI